MRTRPGKSAARASAREEVHAPSRTPSRPRDRPGASSESGSQWTSGRRVCTSTGKRRFGVVTNTLRPTRSASRTKRRWRSRAADVLDHRVREHDVELAVTERKGARVALDVPNARVARTEPLAVLQPERGDPLRPGVALLEEVERATPVALAERKLVGARRRARWSPRSAGARRGTAAASASASAGRWRQRVASGVSIRSGVASRLAPMVEAVLRRGRSLFAPAHRENRDLERTPDRGAVGLGPAALRRQGGRPRLVRRAPSSRRASCSRSTTTRPASIARYARDPLLGPSVRLLRGLRSRGRRR